MHLSVLLGVFVLAKAADYWLDRFDLVTGSGSLFTGMGYTDDNAVLPAKEILTGIALICAVLFFLNIWRRTWMLPSLGIALFALSAILLGLDRPRRGPAVPGQPQRARQGGPLHRREHRGDAGGLRPRRDRGRVLLQRAQHRRTATSTTFDAATSSVPLVDPKVVSQTFEQQQQVRAYYSVPDVLDVDRYEIDGKDRAVVLGVRELDQAGIADGDKTWSNLHTVYTHGNGVIAAFANQRPEDDERQSTNVQWAEGQETDESSLTNLTPDGYESRVYYGEKSPTYSIVGKQSADGTDLELDLPKGERGDENQTTTYDGEGGVPIGNLFDKVLYAVKFGEPNLVLSGPRPREQQDPLRPPPAHHGGEGRPVADRRLRPLPGGRRRPDQVGARRLHRHRQVPALAARVAGDDDRRLAGRGPRASRRCRPTRSTTCATRSRRPSTPTTAR